jgi:hypothetical protein
MNTPSPNSQTPGSLPPIAPLFDASEQLALLLIEMTGYAGSALREGRPFTDSEAADLREYLVTAATVRAVEKADYERWKRQHAGHRGAVLAEAVMVECKALAGIGGPR